MGPPGGCLSALRETITGLTVALLVGIAPAPAAEAQTNLGRVSWNLGGFCDVIVVQVTETSATFALHGFTQETTGCEMPETIVFPTSGSAAVGPNGEIQVGFTIIFNDVTAHVFASLNAVSLEGTWFDDFGHTGLLTFLGSGAPERRVGAPAGPLAPSYRATRRARP